MSWLRGNSRANQAAPVAAAVVNDLHDLAATKVFGVALEQGIRNKNVDGIPFVIDRCLQFIEKSHMDTEGVFRLSGAATLVNSLKEKFDRGEDVEFNHGDVHAAAQLVKLYLRELPEPLLTYELFDAFSSTQGNGLEETLRVRLLRACVRALPQQNYNLLRRLTGFLTKLHEHSAQNKMTLTNLATVHGPNILRPPREESPLQLVANTALANSVAHDLISRFIDIFEGPPLLPKIVRLARAQYAFTPEASDRDGEISFEEDAILFVWVDGDDGWWDGEIVTKKGSQATWSRGCFPSSYVQVISNVVDEGDAIDLDAIQRAKSAKEVKKENANSSSGNHVAPEELQTLNQMLKQAVTERREMEALVRQLAGDFTVLQTRIMELEKSNGALLEELIQVKEKLDSYSNGSTPAVLSAQPSERNITTDEYNPFAE